MPEAKGRSDGSRPDAAGASDEGVGAMSIFGTPPSDYVAIPSTTISLVCALGRTAAGNHCLVPYVNLRLLKPENEDFTSADDMVLTPAFQATLSYENCAYVLMDLSGDFGTAAKRIGFFATGDLKPEPERLAYAIECLNTARRNLDEAISQLEAVRPAASPRRTRKPPAPHKLAEKAKSATNR